MVRKNSVDPRSNPDAPPGTPPPSPPPSTESGPTGTSGFSMQQSVMQQLQNNAGDLQTRLSAVSGELSALHLSPNALGPVGLAAVPALNAANDTAVAQAERGSKAFGEIRSGLRTSQQMITGTDTQHASALSGIDPVAQPSVHSAPDLGTPAASAVAVAKTGPAPYVGGGSSGSVPHPAGAVEPKVNLVTKVHSGTAPAARVPGPVVTAKQQTMLDLHGVQPVEVPGKDARSSLVNAIADTMVPRNRQELVTRLNSHSDTSIAGLATAAGARVHVLGADGKFTSHGPVTGVPVHVVETKSPDTRYHATKENVHIGRPGVSYPGPTKLAVHGNQHTVHRGEFEIETIAGRHHVRVYTAVVNPASFDMTDPARPTSAFKDIQQDPATGRLNISTGSNAQLWAGAGRPQRALQWLAKYEHTDGGQPIDPRKPADVKRPVLRSFLVPLDTFTKITSGATVEGAPGATSRTDTYNVDQRGEPNQFGIGGDHLAELVKHAEPGSLISYPSNPSAAFAHSDLAGRITPASDLYQRLGLGPDFRSDALGKAYDPWFSWTRQPDGSWKFDGFRNDARKLHEIATQVREHHLAFQQSKQDPNLRFERLNRFLNEVGPASVNVDKVTNEVLSTGPGALRDYLAPGGTPAADQAAFQRVMSKIVPEAVRDATKDADTLIKQMKGPVTTLPELRNLIADGFKPKSGPTRLFAEQVVDKIADRFVARIEKHQDLALLTDDSRRLAAGAMRDQVRHALTDGFANLSDVESHAPGGKKGGWLSGARLTEFGKIVADHVAAQPPPVTEVTVDPAKLAEVARNKVFADVATDALHGFTGHDLVNTSPDQLKSVVANDVLPKWSNDIAAAIREHPSMSLADKDFRESMADAVARDARTRAEQALARFTFHPVDQAEVDAFMAKAPEIATQAEIGALISTDSDQIALDPRTRTQDGNPFPNAYHEWNQAR